MTDDDLTTAEAISLVARAIHWLGNADAATPMGGLEGLGAVMKEGMAAIAASLDYVGSHLGRLADAVEESRTQ